MKRVIVLGIVAAMCAFSAPTFRFSSQAATVASNPAVIHLKPDGTGDYATLQEAADRAADGATVFLAAGTYTHTASVRITKPLRLVGEGWERTVIVGTDGDCVLWVSVAGEFVMEGIAFVYQGEGPADVVVVEVEWLDVTACSFSGAVQAPPQRSWAGLRIIGATRGYVRECVASGNTGEGITLEGEAQVTLESNNCSENPGGCGIAFLGSAAGMAVRNVCRANGQAGILVGESAQPTLEENTCSENVRDGINVADEAQPTILRNLCLDNGDDGIGFEGASGGIARGNECLRNAWAGIWVSGVCQPTIEYNTCSENGIAGIAFFNDAGGTVFDSAFERNSIGILIGGTAHPALARCSVVDSGRDKTVSAKFPNRALREVDLWELLVLVWFLDWPFEDISPGFGVYMYGTATLEMSDCQISGSMITGLRLSGEASARIANSRILNNAHGIELIDSAQAHVEGTVSSRNRYTAVDVSGTAQAVLESCELLGNLVGLRAQNEAELTVRDTRVCDNILGALLEGSARAEFSQTAVCRSTCAPVALWGNAQVSFAGCTFSGNALDDVLLGWEPYGLVPGKTVAVRVVADGTVLAFPESPPPAVEAVVDSIVEVWPSGRDPVTGKYWEFAANGVILASGAIATVGHVFYGEDSGDPRVWLRLSSLEVVDADSQDRIYQTRDFLIGMTAHGPHPAAIDTSRDIAALYPANPTVSGLPVARAAAPYEAVWAVGYVGFLETVDAWRCLPGVVSIPDRSLLRLLFLSWATDERREGVYPDLFIALTPGVGTVPGMSGSPVVNVHGEAVGIIMRTYTYNGSSVGAARLVDLPKLKPLPKP